MIMNAMHQIVKETFYQLTLQKDIYTLFLNKLRSRAEKFKQIKSQLKKEFVLIKQAKASAF